MITACNEIMRNIRGRPVRVDVALLVHKLLNQTSVGEDDGSASAQFERVHAAILPGPFGEPVMVESKNFHPR